MKNTAINNHIRNIAIIAHVDHGKTTLVDAMFRQSGVFRDGQQVVERIMDSMDLEKERGITIAAKNCSILWKDVKINIIDTPGHADFGGEVERSLSMADGAILLVDSSEGPLPQTRFVLEKTLAAGLPVIVVINKIDRKDSRVSEVLDEIYDLLIDLGASEKQLECPILYAIGRDGIAKMNLNEEAKDLSALFDAIVREIPPPAYDPDEPFQMLVSDLGYSDYLGRLAIGKIAHGTVSINDKLHRIDHDNQSIPLKTTKLQIYQGVQMVETQQATAGEIILLSGIQDVNIGDTICTNAVKKALKRITVDEPTVAMTFTRNDSPLAGKEGEIVQFTKIAERLNQETFRNVAIDVEKLESGEGMLVKGRGEFQLAILIETMRREGYEFCVGRPKVIFKYQDGERLEPIEQLFIDLESSFVGVITEKLSIRKGKMINLVNKGTGRVRLEFSVPSRSLIGFRDEFMTDSKGTGIMNSYIAGYEEYRGDFPTRFTGSLVSDRAGHAVAYGLYNLEPRGRLFIVAGEPLYEGMIIGEHNKENDINVNPAREKKLTNIRAAAKDENVTLSPIKPMTLESAINFIRDDEMLEITPKSLRLRKSILGAQKRHAMRALKHKQS